MPKKTTALLLGTFILLVVILSLYVEPIYGFRINKSESLPYNLFFRVKASPTKLKSGSIVTFHRECCPIQIAKEVIGFPGDYIRLKEDKIFLNDIYLGEVQKVSQTGKRYHSISEGTIPDGYVFVYGNHQQSFDSRYQEFGLVKIEEIEDILWPLF